MACIWAGVRTTLSVSVGLLLFGVCGGGGGVLDLEVFFPKEATRFLLEELNIFFCFYRLVDGVGITGMF